MVCAKTDTKAHERLAKIMACFGKKHNPIDSQSRYVKKIGRFRLIASISCETPSINVEDVEGRTFVFSPINVELYYQGDGEDRMPIFSCAAYTTKDVRATFRLGLLIIRKHGSDFIALYHASKKTSKVFNGVAFPKGAMKVKALKTNFDTDYGVWKET